MPLITDPDDLNQTVEVDFDPVLKTITLNLAGNLSADGVTLKALYSFAKEEWKADSTLIKFPFPFTPITDEFFELKDGWDFNATASENLIRRSGWLVRDLSGNRIKQFAGIAILSAEADDQIYFRLAGQTTPTNFVYSGNTAEAVQIIDDPNGDGSYADGFDRSANIDTFNRQPGQLYSFASTAANGEASLLAPKLFSLGLPTGSDLKIVETDVNIDSNAPYNGMSITFFSTPQSRLIGATNRDFGIIIDGNNGTAEQIYEFVQRQLRLNSDIDDGAGNVIGQLADALLLFVGDNLETLNATNPAGGGTGVYIDNFQAADTNRIAFRDNTETARTFPFVAVVQLNFSLTLQADSDSEYFVFFTDASGNDFGDTDAILVNDNGGSPVTGLVSGSPFIQFDFDYDGNNQGGRTPGTDAAITVVAIGLNGAQHVVATGVITRSTANAVSLVSPTERQYENAA
ncbi:MAG: hypothetical protein F6K48_20720 [Okeania sp. SIO3H1]|nr:hypothetical protein [Okeania sp. SIO3H1]